MKTSVAVVAAVVAALLTTIPASADENLFPPNNSPQQGCWIFTYQVPYLSAPRTINGQMRVQCYQTAQHANAPYRMTLKVELVTEITGANADWPACHPLDTCGYQRAPGATEISVYPTGWSDAGIIGTHLAGAIFSQYGVWWHVAAKASICWTPQQCSPTSYNPMIVYGGYYPYTMTQLWYRMKG